MEGPKEPHPLSLKVLRLSRPSLSLQSPLPSQDPNARSALDPKAALSFPLAQLEDKLSLTPLLTLPPAFGSAYVGEQFACTLCANNELAADDETKAIVSAKLEAEIQTPSQTVRLELMPQTDSVSIAGLKTGQNLQKSLQFDLREAGNHVLAVVLSYTETTTSGSGNAASSGRARSFRKLYQFVARPCLAVRTKTSVAVSAVVDQESPKGVRKDHHVLEAQLENLADAVITLEEPDFETKHPFQSTSINWGILHPDQTSTEPPILAPGEVTQVAFLISEGGNQVAQPMEGKELTKDGRTILGTLRIRWRNAMGDRGELSTGLLTTRKI